MATIQGIYLALFGRPADPTGLAYFNGVTKNGADLSGIGNLAGQKEYTDRFTGKSTNDIINSIYQSLFGRDGESAGVAFWANKLATGALTVNNIAIAILDGALGSDKTIITAKIAAADLFTTHLDLPAEQQAYGANTVSLARDYITTIGSTHAGTGTEVDAVIARMLTNAGQAPGDGGDTSTGGGGGSGPTTPVNTAPVLAFEPVATKGQATLVVENSKDVGKITATDDSGVAPTLTLKGDDAAKFEIDQNGNLHFKEAPDFEAHGSLAGTNEYHVTIEATDGLLTTSQTITVNVIDIDEPISGVANKAPDAIVQDATLSGYNVLEGASDPEGHLTATLTAEIVSTSDGNYSGTASITDGLLTFTPDATTIKALDAGETATFVVNYTVSDGSTGDGHSVDATTTIVVNGIDDPISGVVNKTPDAIAQDATLSGYNVLDGASDPEGHLTATLTAATVSTSDGKYSGTASIADGLLTFTPDATTIKALNAGETATFVVNYTVSDGGTGDGHSVDATTTIVVNGIDDPISGVANKTPDAISQNATLSGYNVLDGASDPEGHLTATLTAATVSSSDGKYSGTASITDGLLTFTPDATTIKALDAGETATFVVNYTVSDGGTDDGHSVAATTTVVVNGVNDAPTITAEGNLGSDGTYVVSATDPDDTKITFSKGGGTSPTSPSYGTLNIPNSGPNKGQVVYTLSDSSKGFVGDEKFTVTADDGHTGGKTTSVVTVHIQDKSDTFTLASLDTAKYFNAGDATHLADKISLPAGSASFSGALSTSQPFNPSTNTDSSPTLVDNAHKFGIVEFGDLGSLAASGRTSSEEKLFDALLKDTRDGTSINGMNTTSNWKGYIVGYAKAVDGTYDGYIYSGDSAEKGFSSYLSESEVHLVGVVHGLASAGALTADNFSLVTSV